MAKQQDIKMVVELSEYDRVLIQQLIDRLANPVQPTLPWPEGVPGPQTQPWGQAPQWWQNPVIYGTSDSTSESIKAYN